MPIDPLMSTMTSTAQETVASQNVSTTPQVPTIDKETKKRNGEFKTRIDACKNYKKKLIPNWTRSVEYRVGKPLASQSDTDRITVNLDWSLTKAKQSALFSQTPQVRVDHHPETQNAPWVSAFERKLNDALAQAGVEDALDECLPDCINAAGFGAVLVSHDAMTEMVDVPLGDPSMASLGAEIKTIQVPRVIDRRYTIMRISPADFLWPLEFTGSNFDNAPWLGRTGRVTWAEAVRLFNLKDEDKDKVIGDDRSVLDRMNHDIEREKSNEDLVSFDEIWYKDFQYNAGAKSYFTLKHLIFLTGKEDPIESEWEGQRLEEGILIGASKFPLRALTLTYISDEAIPPSDSAIGRPQVDEINKARTQMILQRERSLPVRWFDVNRVDSTIAQALMRGTWQNMIPVQGAGDHIIGEVARASMPQEDFTFDQIAKNDLNEEWSISPNQAGSGKGIETAAEANSVQASFQTRVGRERAKVAKFFVGIAEVLGGLLSLNEDPASFGQGFDPVISRTLSYSILADSTVLVDANQRLQRLMQFINFAAKSGWVDVGVVLKEVATLSGLDPSLVIKPPQPKPPVEPTISLRLTGSEDLTNPIAYAFLMKSGQAPSPDLIEQAKQSIAIGLTPPSHVPIPLNGAPLPIDAPPPPASISGEAHPQWEAMPRLNKRADGENGGKS